MLRPGHFYYDLRKHLADPMLLVGIVVIGGFFVLFISADFLYLVALLLAGVFAVRGLIGRRCPKCDTALKETEASVDRQDAFKMNIKWACPNPSCEGHSEDEKTEGDAGLFGVK